MSPQMDEMLTLSKLIYELDKKPQPWCFGHCVVRAYLIANQRALSDESKVKWWHRLIPPPDWDGTFSGLQRALDLEEGKIPRGYYLVEELPEGPKVRLTWHSPDGQKEPPIEVHRLWISNALEERARLAQLPVGAVGEIAPVAAPSQLGVPS